LEQATFNPQSTFSSPEEVRDSQSFSPAQKVRILKSWEYDAAELAVAEEEGMLGGNGDMLRRILLALNSVAGEVDVERTGPTKQHGLSD
jgi:hypothetical protein